MVGWGFGSLRRACQMTRPSVLSTNLNSKEALGGQSSCTASACASLCVPRPGPHAAKYNSERASAPSYGCKQACCGCKQGPAGGGGSCRGDSVTPQLSCWGDSVTPSETAKAYRCGPPGELPLQGPANKQGNATPQACSAASPARGGASAEWANATKERPNTSCARALRAAEVPCIAA